MQFDDYIVKLVLTLLYAIFPAYCGANVRHSSGYSQCIHRRSDPDSEQNKFNRSVPQHQDAVQPFEYALHQQTRMIMLRVGNSCVQFRFVLPIAFKSLLSEPPQMFTQCDTASM
ncbi:hypothetical protein PLICRDRAFT_223772 [Plicaturopsis crispa FD-325 SS-3]|nr:hypothetical protein PLICRDRAFT_223772 [Plicaturopsis crispa FD-325 SS-3]